MKLKPILMAGALAALPFGAAAQQSTTEQRTTTTDQQTTTTRTGDAEITTITGTVQSYNAGHSITITNENGDQTTYTIDESSQVPKTLQVGKTVTVRTTTVSGNPMVKTITVTRTTTSKKKSY